MPIPKSAVSQRQATENREGSVSPNMSNQKDVDASASTIKPAVQDSANKTADTVSPPPNPSPSTQPMEMEESGKPQDKDDDANKKVRFTPKAVSKAASKKAPSAATKTTYASAQSKQERDLENLLKKVQQRAARRRLQHHRKRHNGSPPPPPPSPETDAGPAGTEENEEDEETKIKARMQHLQRLINYMEKEIQTAARMELALLNQSKALRDQRQKMTKKFELMSKKKAAMQRKLDNKNNGGDSKPAAIVDGPPALSNRMSASASLPCRPRPMQQSNRASLPPLLSSSAKRGRRVSPTGADVKVAAAAASKNIVLIDLSECASECD